MSPKKVEPEIHISGNVYLATERRHVFTSQVTSMPRVLITDRIAAEGVRILEQATEVDFRTGLNEDELVELIPDYDALVVRSQTKVTQPIIEHAERLRVIGRAGVGVDNIDTDAATEKGVVVVNSETRPSGPYASASSVVKLGSAP